MSTTSPSTCALGLGPETLSAWRDSMLSASEAAHVEAHIAGCGACRAHLADYATIADAIVAERVPSPDASLWRELRVRLRAAPARPTLHLSRSWLGTIAAAAAVLLVVVGFARLFNGMLSRGSADLAWQSVSLPAGIGFYYRHGLGLSASDGNTAYACAPTYDTSGNPTGTSDPATQIYLTRDRGQHWAHISDLPDQTKAHGCYVIASATDPLTAIATTSIATVSNELDSAVTKSYLTTDGGITWQMLPDPQTRAYEIRALASANKRPFALVGTDLATTHLMTSDSSMLSWSPVDQEIASAGENIVNFWALPGTSATVELLAEAENPNYGHLDLWYTDSGGKRWTKVTPTQLASDSPTYYAVRQSSVPGPWQACAVTYSGAQKLALSTLICTSDGGETWTSRAAPQLPGSDTASTSVFSYVRDGALLGLVVNSRSTTLYRLLPGATTWQSLGTLPQRLALPAYEPAPSDGVFWQEPDFTNHGDSVDPHGLVYTAAYGKTPSVAPAWTPAPTPVPMLPADAAVTGPTLSWHALAGNHYPLIAPGDGDIAYECGIGSSDGSASPLSFWATHDRGASWQRMADIPSHQQTDGCQLFIDPGNASRIVVALDYRGPGYGGAGINEQTYQLFATTDGGASWHALPTQHGTQQLMGLASYGNTTYAIRDVLGQRGPSYPGYIADLYATTDGMRTWQPLTYSLTGSSGDTNVMSFWVNQATGTVLVETGNTDMVSAFYRSDDGGQHWTPLTNAPISPNADYVAQLSGSGQTWRVCALYDDSTATFGYNRIACSADGGLHWSAQPVLVHDASGRLITSDTPIAIASDGALLVAGTPNQSNTGELFRLPVGAAKWQQLTQRQGNGASILPTQIIYEPQPGIGLLWAADANGHPLVTTYP